MAPTETCSAHELKELICRYSVTISSGTTYQQPFPFNAPRFVAHRPLTFSCTPETRVTQPAQHTPRSAASHTATAAPMKRGCEEHHPPPASGGGAANGPRTNGPNARRTCPVRSHPVPCPPPPHPYRGAGAGRPLREPG